MRRSLIFITFFVFLLITRVVVADYWYVDRDASGSNNGSSWFDAWRAFDDIRWNSVSPGDTIFISGGPFTKTYYETLRIGKSGTLDNPISIKTGAVSPNPSGHEGRVVIDANDTLNNFIVIGSHDYIHIDGNDGSGGRNIYCEESVQHGIISSSPSIGLVIKYVHLYDMGNSDQGDSGNGMWLGGLRGKSEIAFCYIDTTWRHGLLIGGQPNASSYGEHFSLHDSTIIGAGEDAINANGGFDLYNNVIGRFRMTGTEYSDGIQYFGGYVRIYNNLWHENYPSDPGVGQRVNAMVFMSMGSGSITQYDHHQIFNNLFIASDWSYDDGGHNRAILYKHTTGMSPEIDLRDVLVANNTMIGYSSAFAINPYSSSCTYTNLRIKNNIIMDGRLSFISMGMNFDSANSTIEIEDNLFYYRSGRCSQNLFSFDGSSYESLGDFETNVSAASSNEWGDPSFVAFVEGDYDNSDYHLSSTDTKAIDLAQTLSDFFKDKDGVFRPQGGGWDIGAFEYTTSNPSNSINPNPPMNLRILE